MNKIKTYTPTNFRRNLYGLLNQVKDNKDIRITIQPKNGGANSNILVTNQDKITKLYHQLDDFKKEKLAHKIDWYASQLSDNPVITNPKDFERWCEKNDD